MQKTINMILKHNKSLKIKSLTKTGTNQLNNETKL